MRIFGFRLALGLNVAGCIMFHRGKGHFIWFTGAGVLVLMFAILFPGALKPLKKILDFLILLIGRIVNAISMAIAFYLIFTPIAILLRLFRKDILGNRPRESYWSKRNSAVFSKESYSRMG
ncbi:MAG: hypothetical protein KKH08_04020 [Candidatus Omnitrophica bacterium]|nr:hypothetical protein [Candidatus Omnitrophota bacterium]